MRKLVGPTDVAAFDNPSGTPVYPYLDEDAYRSVFDFGCGCGRVARQLMQQQPRPERYVEVDMHRGMIQWCRDNLEPVAQGFEFHHHDVHDSHFNPDESAAEVRRLPGEDSGFTLVNAFSVFTHITQRHVPFYLGEVSRVLTTDGVLHSTWFLFDKREFPLLQDHNNALYADDVFPRAAVIFDARWVRAVARDAGLIIHGAIPPEIRGRAEVELPEDRGRIESVDLPDMPVNADRIGL
jgi:SAM-dependent methyltransferase